MPSFTKPAARCCCTYVYPCAVILCSAASVLFADLTSGPFIGLNIPIGSVPLCSICCIPVTVCTVMLLSLCTSLQCFASLPAMISSSAAPSITAPTGGALTCESSFICFLSVSISEGVLFFLLTFATPPPFTCTVHGCLTLCLHSLSCVSIWLMFAII